MKTSAELERELRERYSIKSNYRIAKALGLTPAAISAHKRARERGMPHVFSDETGYRLAELLGYDPAYILACLAAERAKRPGIRAAWERVARVFEAAEQAARAAAKVAMLLIGLSFLAAPDGTRAGATPPGPGGHVTFDHFIHYATRRLRAWRAALTAALTPARGCA